MSPKEMLVYHVHASFTIIYFLFAEWTFWSWGVLNQTQEVCTFFLQKKKKNPDNQGFTVAKNMLNYSLHYDLLLKICISVCFSKVHKNVLFETKAN